MIDKLVIPEELTEGVYYDKDALVIYANKNGDGIADFVSDNIGHFITDAINEKLLRPSDDEIDKLKYEVSWFNAQLVILLSAKRHNQKEFERQAEILTEMFENNLFGPEYYELREREGG